MGRQAALLFYQHFKFEFVAVWGDEFSISENEINDWIKTFNKDYD
ncbi:unnamed protein product [marine sediment metagenome]|uniref:Uncharacterized protein n=1 Tax=marine sediment metagenome TaxID=412755 RepID=X1TLM8_9ZZZZ